MSDDVGGRGVKHMLMGKLDSFSCCMCKILAVIGDMVDVDLRKQNLNFG